MNATDIRFVSINILANTANEDKPVVGIFTISLKRDYFTALIFCSYFL